MRNIKIITIVMLVIFGMTSALAADPIVTESTSNSTVTTKGDNKTTVKSPPPSAISPSINSSNSDLCTVGISGAVQTQILGISGGKTVRDLNCERLKLAKTIYDMGMKVAAVSIMCQDERVFNAMEMAGTPCPYFGKIGEEAQASWEAAPERRPENIVEEKRQNDNRRRLLKRALGWSASVVFAYFFSSVALATDTPAPSYPTTTTPDTIDLDDGTITSPSGGCPSGTSTAYVYGSGSTIRFGECVNTFAVSYAINQALQGSGVSIDKAHYEWKYIHCFNEPGKFCSVDIEDRVNTETGEITDDTYWDELVVVVEITDSNGNVVETKTWTMDTWYEWTTSNAHSDNEVQEGSTYWQIHADNIEIYNHTDKVGTIRTPNSVGDIRFRITGYDEGNWDGYYGPIIKDLKTWFTYRANPCDDTALYDPSCPGYATAYAAWEYDQNCSANALYDPGLSRLFYCIL